MAFLNNTVTGVGLLDSIYHMTLKLLLHFIFGHESVKDSIIMYTALLRTSLHNTLAVYRF